MHAADVAQWLQANPQFFEEYADLISDIFIPHPHGGRAIPIAERQIITLREKNRVYETKLGELLQFGEENDQIGEKMHRLSVALLHAGDLAAVLGAVQYQLQEHFHVAHVAMRLWADERDDTLLEYAPVSEEVQTLALSLDTPYCGPYVTDEVLGWLGEAGLDLKSFAQVALRQDNRVIGILVMGAADPQRFYPEMGTLYLARLGDLASAALDRWLA